MPLPSIAILQDETSGGETTGSVIKGAAEAAQNIPKQTGQELSGISTLFNDIITYLGSPAFIVDVAATVVNYVSGQQRFTIEVQLKDEEAANRVLEEIQEGHELYLIPPRLVDRNETPEGGPRLRLLAVVLPSTAWLVEENLVERIKASAGEDSLAAEPLVYKVDSRNVQRLREFIREE